MDERAPQGHPLKSEEESSPPLDRLVPALEAILFAAVDPVPVDRLSTLLGISPGVATTAIDRLRRELTTPGRGVEVVERGGGFQLVTKSAFARDVGRLMEEPQEAPLSQASLETLAIVAYRQPITRAEIEAVRGVHSKRALDNLSARGLITGLGRKEAPGRPVLWGTTQEFLIAFGLSDVSELPPLRIEAIERDVPKQTG